MIFLAEKDTEFLQTQEPFRRVHLIGGEYATVDTNSIVGYCHNKEHIGFLTIEIMNKHDCINKGCNHFEKFFDYPFWQKYYRREEQKQARKDKLKKIREVKRQQATNQEKKNEVYISFAYQIAAKLELKNFKIVGIHPANPGFTIFYISDKSFNDWYSYREIAFALNKAFKKKFTLKHAKGKDGTYATI